MRKIAVIGPHADRVRSAFGAYTYASMIDMLEDNKNNNKEARQNSGEIMAAVYQRFAGDLRETPLYVEEMIRKLYPKTKSLYEAIADYLPDAEVTVAQGISYTGTNLAGYERALDMAAEADLVILTLGGQSGWGAVATNGEGVDNSNIDLPGIQEQFARDVYALNRKTVVVHMDGRPLCNAFVISHFDAVFEAWQVGEYGFEELTKIIFGELNPSGHLPVTIPKSIGQIPVYYGQLKGSGYGNMGLQNTYASNFGYINADSLPLFPFGYGLSYTEFQYRELVLSKQKIRADEILDISVLVANVGKWEGDTVVQLYICDECSSIVRPRRQLAGFARVSLKRGEQKMVRFNLYPSQFAFPDENMRWKIEAGGMKLMVGDSAENILLTETFEIINDAYIDETKREFYMIGKVVGGNGDAEF